LALTLTVRDCPASSDDWHRIRDVFIKRLALRLPLSLGVKRP